MKNSGFMKVFTFSYVQNMKAKSTKVMLLIFVVIALLSYPVSTLISGGADIEEENKGKIEKVYIKAADSKFVDIIKGNLDKDVNLVSINDEEYKEVVEELKDTKENVLYLEVNYSEDLTSEDFGVTYKVVHSEKGEEAANTLDSVLSEKSRDIVLRYYGVEEEQLSNFNSSVYEVKIYDAEGNEIVDDSGLDEAEYLFSYGVIMVLIIISSFLGSLVAEGIVSEKANRVIEYIMVNLRPMDLIMGKIFSSIAYILSMFAAVFAALMASSFINKMSLDPNGNTIFDTMGTIFDTKVMTGLSIPNIILVIVLVLIGLYFYGILGGLCGGMVSKVEEMGEGVKFYVIILMVGAYLAMGLSMASNISGEGWGTMSYVVYLMPISSMFIIPSYLLIGKISVVVVLGALGVLIVFSGLLTALASRIFGQMLYHNGSPLKIKDIISFSKGQGAK